MPASLPFGARVFGVVALIALSTSTCTRSRSLQLPEDRQGDLGFAVLYDDSERVAAVGPVVRRQTLYSGSYVVEADDSDLRARVFFVALRDLIATAEGACGDLASLVDQIACNDL